MDLMSAINAKKNEISRYSNDVNKIKNENLVNKTKFEQFQQERQNIINELTESGYNVNELSSTINFKIKELDTLTTEIQNIIYAKEYNVRDSVNIPLKDM